MYGEQVSFKLDGKSHTQTCLGGVLSLLTLVVAAIYMVLKGQDLLSRGENKYQMFQNPGLLDLSRQFSMDEMGVDMAFVIAAKNAASEDQLLDVLQLEGKYITVTGDGE